MAFPELDRFPTKKEGRAASSAAMRRQLRKWQFWACIVAYYAVGSLTLIAVLHVIGKFVPVPASARGGFIGGLLGGMSWGAIQWFWRKPIRLDLRRQLQDLQIPICLHCGYDLRGQHEARCPECGNAFDGSLLVAASPELL